MPKSHFAKSQWKALRFYLIEAGIIILFIQFVSTLAIVNGSSMENTLQDRNILIVWRLGYTPRLGDVVLINKKNSLGINLTKRVVAVAGQRIEINEDGVYIDGQLQDEPYLKDPYWSRWPMELTVPEGQVFVMGDNRDSSTDSREIGCLEASNVKGKIVWRLWPFGVLT